MAKKSAKDKLKLQPQRFCVLYASDREFFGNGTQAYIEAYNYEVKTKADSNVVRGLASRLLTNANILAYINELLDLTLNNVHVDKQLAFLVTQDAELNVKLGAIKEYNLLKTRITNKIQLGLDKATATLLGLIDGSSKGKLPTKGEQDI